MALSQFSITNAKPKDKPYMLTDGDGLHLLVYTSGSKLWRIRFQFAGKANMMSLGSFPEVSLIEARKRRDDVKVKIAAGINPSVAKKLEKIAAQTAGENTFGAIAEEYLLNLEKNGAAPQTLSKNRWLLTDLARALTKRPIAEIKPAEILTILKAVEKSGRRDTAHRLRSVIGSVCRYAVATLRAENDPTYALRGALMKVKSKNRAAITDERDVGAFLRALDEYEGWPIVNAAFRFLVLTMARPGDVRHMKREEVIWEKKLWRIPAERMKMRRPHDVPLSRQALTILKEVWPLNEENELVFPSLRSHKKPLSENAFNSVLRNMGYDKNTATAHGFRSTASTICNERRIAHEDVIEAALAHQEENEVRRAYLRSTFLPQRTKLMQQWADLLDSLKSKGKRREAA
ncbi:tyrosine-type recombinase/integrase [Bradyrhizobium sp. USDA 4452]